MEESDVNVTVHWHLPLIIREWLTRSGVLFTLTAETIVDASDAQIHYEI